MNTIIYKAKGRNITHDFDDCYGKVFIVTKSYVSHAVCTLGRHWEQGLRWKLRLSIIGNNTLGGMFVGTICFYPQHVNYLLGNVASSYPCISQLNGQQQTLARHSLHRLRAPVALLKYSPLHYRLHLAADSLPVNVPPQNLASHT